MPEHGLLDTHIHLWPSTATTPQDHAWMAHVPQLAKRHGIAEYRAATSTSPIQPRGFVYVETDRYLPDPEPLINPASSAEMHEDALRMWAGAALQELAFLRRVVEGRAEPGDGSTGADAELVKGLVIWAPFHLPPSLFSLYLDIAEETLGRAAWGRVVGFRYLLQGKSGEEIRSIVEGDGRFGENLRLVSGRGKGFFDVGVDCHRDGVEGLEVVAGLVESSKEKGVEVKWVLNHLCKPDLTVDPWPSMSRYRSAISRLAAHPNVYMKFSGAFNEISPSSPTIAATDIVKTLRPTIDRILAAFGAKRIMFGSDWPVCNIGGPKGESGNWAFWREIVEKYMDEREFERELREWVWWRTGVEAYGLGPL